MEDEEDEERLSYIKDVIERHVVCCTMLENLQSAHYSMLKAKQQAQHLSYMPKELIQKLESNTKEQAILLHMLADHKVQLERCLKYAQRELLTPVIYPHVFPHSEWLPRLT